MDGHHEASVPRDTDDRPVWVDELERECGRQAPAHPRHTAGGVYGLGSLRLEVVTHPDPVVARVQTYYCRGVQGLLHQPNEALGHNGRRVHEKLRIVVVGGLLFQRGEGFDSLAVVFVATVKGLNELGHYFFGVPRSVQVQWGKDQPALRSSTSIWMIVCLLGLKRDGVSPTVSWLESLAPTTSTTSARPTAVLAACWPYWPTMPRAWGWVSGRVLFPL